ncbi:DUF2490 domain-containing protein [Chryseobacterium sp. SNU WT5]|uniref:DUF2490 domain-containing protein n=1 Tax=Chryseobacterium sp. SNU WT5 TaxID=2594269 RepID=UPI00117DFF61|nr:DUF2490 domain-containing protein [Chryseobacterium sp. SNU WT5]QDP84189.1 DUF2490 domain-containing protein [Chryseobacterium sp. SNU WT5]
MLKRLFIFILFLFVLEVFAQKETISSYNVVTVNYKINQKYFVYTEGQLRGVADYSYPDYYEMKAGLGYYLSKNHKPLIGIGRYVNYKNHSLEKEEFRVWLQDVYDLKAGNFKFENRVRAEKSWFYNPSKDEHSERIRLRYRLNISVPLNSPQVKPGTISASAFNEVFFVATSNPFFARNRLMGGLSYQIDPNFGMTAGYVWQREFALAGNKNLHFMYLGLSINIDGSKKDEEEIK